MGTQVLRRLAVAAGLIAVGASAGCVTLQVVAPDGQVRVTKHLGALLVGLASPDQAIVGTVSGIGVVGAPLGWTLGYTQQRWALIGSDCRALLWVPPDGLAQPLQDDLVRAAGVCLLDDGRSESKPLTTKE